MSLDTLAVAQVLAMLAAALIAAHVGGHVFSRLHQPRVVGEIVGGLVLGPTLLGSVFPSAWASLVGPGRPAGVLLGVCNQLGLLLLMFASGSQVRQVLHRDERRPVAFITATGVAIPFVCAIAVFSAMDVTDLIGPAHERPALVLVLGLATAVTSIPVISRILHDLGVLHTSFSRIVLGVAVIEDTLVYVVLAIALGLVAHASGDSIGLPAVLDLPAGSPTIAYHVTATAALFAVLLGAGPALLTRYRYSRLALVHRASPIAFQLVVVLLAATACVLLGVAPIFGAFLAGMVLSRLDGEHVVRARDELQRFAFAVFIPVYFATVGMQLDLAHQFDPTFFLAFLGFACVTKTVSVFAGARLGHESPRAALNLAVAMNARGGPGIVLASTAYAAGIVNQSVFASLVLLAMVTSLAAGSWLEVVLRSGRPLRPGKEAAATDPEVTAPALPVASTQPSPVGSLTTDA